MAVSGLSSGMVTLLWTAGIIVLVPLLIYALLRYCRVFVYIANDSYGVVEKIWSRRGSLRSGLISLDGRAGFQPDLLRGGPHFFVPFVYRVHKQRLITVRSMAYVFARDGVALPAGQTLARTPENVSFEDVRGFLSGGGQRGPQRLILREGVYAINTAQFIVITSDTVHAIDVGSDAKTLDSLCATIAERNGFDPLIIRSKEDVVGLVTVHDGPALEHNDLIAPMVGGDPGDWTTFHNSFQVPESFLAAGGRRGRQAQVLVEGTYFINRLFATIEMAPKVIIEVGTVGVVISYTGVAGQDISGADYRHGELVAQGERGVWATPLRPGKYALNPYAQKVVVIPTTNFVLRWIKGHTEGHGFDTDLSEIPMITKDAFEPILPLSVVVHITPERAPRVIQQFADVKLLVDQTIDPMVSAYFKDVAQSRTLLDLISSRAELQTEAKERMRQRFAEYDLDLQEVMIGTPRSQPNDPHIANVLDQLRQRQVAVEQLKTYDSQKAAAAGEESLNEARAKAAIQARLTESAIGVEVSENEGKASLRLREQEAAAIRVLAAATAQQTELTGRAEAARIEAIGLANAKATNAQVAAYTGEGADYQLRHDIAERLATAIEHATVPIVPSVVLQGGGAAGANMVEALMAMLLTHTTLGQDRAGCRGEMDMPPPAGPGSQ